MGERRKSWERRRWESNAEYQAFRCYLGVPGRRSFRQARERAEVMNLACATYALGTWGVWCTENRWVERAKQWDARVYGMARALADVTALALVPSDHLP